MTLLVPKFLLCLKKSWGMRLYAVIHERLICYFVLTNICDLLWRNREQVIRHKCLTFTNTFKMHSAPQNDNNVISYVFLQLACPWQIESIDVDGYHWQTILQCWFLLIVKSSAYHFRLVPCFIRADHILKSLITNLPHKFITAREWRRLSAFIMSRLINTPILPILVIRAIVHTKTLRTILRNRFSNEDIPSVRGKQVRTWGTYRQHENLLNDLCKENDWHTIIRSL